MRPLASVFWLLLLVSCASQNEDALARADDGGLAGKDVTEASQDAEEAGPAQDAGQDAIDEPMAACSYVGSQSCSPLDGFDCCFTSGVAYTYDPTRGCKTSLGDKSLCLKSIHPEGKGCYGEGAATCYFRNDGETWFVVVAAWGVLEAPDASMQRCPLEFSGELEAAGECG